MGIIIRYGIVTLAAAIAALSGRQASGGIWPFSHCGTCCQSHSVCGGGGDHGCRKHRCHKHRCPKNRCPKNRCRRRPDCCREAAMLGVHAPTMSSTPFHGPAASGAIVPMFVHVPQRPPIVIPPGTIGLTYRQVSRLIPASEHPRTGMIEIRGVPQRASLCIEGMEGYRGVNGAWYFRTVHPLLPCATFIHTAYIQTADGALGEYRVFRLIPGRIVAMTW